MSKEMGSLTETSIANMHITLNWKSDNVIHYEHHHAADVNMWRDIFPDSIRNELIGKNNGEKIRDSFFANEIIEREHTHPFSVPLSQWKPSQTNSSQYPFAGRYYPQGYLPGIPEVYPQTLTPMRIVSVNNECITVDTNHPLDGRQIDIEIALEDVSVPTRERGGSCSVRLQEVLDNGPGMQARVGTNPITFDPATAHQRVDNTNDRNFYTEPRIVSHIDSKASEHLASVIRDLVQPGSKVIDLMASVDSHLPQGHGLDVIGLGMNRKEMTANKDLQDFFVYDLNEDPKIPFPDRSFDAVLCNLSIEYLTQPQEVLREVARILRTSGILLISFSNRWFPPKVTRLWTELHEFERMGYVLQLCWPLFNNLKTISYRNWPRPVSDKHFPKLQKSDPLYVITGKLRS